MYSSALPCFCSNVWLFLNRHDTLAASALIYGFFPPVNIRNATTNIMVIMSATRELFVTDMTGTIIEQFIADFMVQIPRTKHQLRISSHSNRKNPRITFVCDSASIWYSF